MEYLDIYDASGRKTGKTVPRGTEMEPGEYFRSVLVAIFSPEGKMLIQQRVGEKKYWGGLWDLSCCGAVSAGEDSRTAGMRELQEELGLTVDLSSSRANFINAFATGFNDTYLLVLDPAPAAETLQLQKEEVQAARYASLEEIQAMLRDGSFLPYKPEWIALLFACRDGSGTINA